MPQIYLTHRREDSGQRAFEQVYIRLAQAFGDESVLRSAGGAEMDVLHLAQVVRGCDALVVVMGRYGLNMLDEAGNRLLDDRLDYLHVELATALADDEKWITVILVDGATLPDDLPEALADLMRRDRISVANEAELDAALDSLIQRIGVAGADRAERDRPMKVQIKKSTWRKDDVSAAPVVAPMTQRERTQLMVMAAIVIPALLICGVLLAGSSFVLQQNQAELTQVMRDIYATNYHPRPKYATPDFIVRQTRAAGTATGAAATAVVESTRFWQEHEVEVTQYSAAVERKVATFAYWKSLTVTPTPSR